MVKSASISKFRSATSQLCAAFPYFCLNMCYGSSVGFQTILIAELYKDNSEITSNVNQLSSFGEYISTTAQSIHGVMYYDVIISRRKHKISIFIASLDALNLIGMAIGGTLTQYFGTRSTALLSSLLFSLSWLLYYHSSSISTVIIARILGTLTATLSLTNPYVSEISESKLRGTFLVISQMALLSGNFIPLLLITFMYWRTIALINLSMPILTTVTVLLVPNSPIWLVSKGRFHEAKNALCSVRGWVQPNQVESEFRTLVENTQKSVSNVEDKKIGWRKHCTRMSKLFLQRSFYSPLATMCLIFLVYTLGGAPLVDSYAPIMFQQLKSPIDESVATAILGAMSIIGKLIVIIFVRRFGKRKLVLLFSVVVFFCQTLTATIALLDFTDGYYVWIPTISLILTNLSWKSGIAAISYILVSEIFSSDIRYIGSAVCFSFYSIVISILKKWFLYVVEAVTLPVVFVMFAVVNAIEVVTYYLVMPETEGKTLREIEDHFKRDKTVVERSKESSI